MNQTIQIQLNHRSIRKYKNTPIPAEMLETIFQVGNQTATSMGAQSFSIIRIIDKDKKAKFASLCKQPYIADMPELILIVADAYRNAKIAEELGADLPAKKDVDRFFQAFMDGCLAAQNMMTAIESLGLGGVFLGSIFNQIEEIISLVELPEYTFPVVGIGFGYPAELPELKPRMKTELKVFENSYQKNDHYVDSLKEYDDVMKLYYDSRNQTNSVPAFTQQIVQRLKNANPMRNILLQVIQKQGFVLNVDSKKTEE